MFIFNFNFFQSRTGISDMNDMLPNPRELSYSLVTDSDENDNYNTFDFSDKTMAVGIWALFIGQDMSHTVVSSSGMANELLNYHSQCICLSI